MRKIIFILFGVLFFVSCQIKDDYELTLDEKLHQYDLWFVNKQESSGVIIPFFEKSFTVSFSRGMLYSNINLVGIGTRGNGIGQQSGFYSAADIFLGITYKGQGYSFEVEQISDNKIVLHDRYSDAKYVLEGYQRSRFDYNRVFMENLQYFLQEYEVWEKVGQQGGNPNPFDAETYLKFIPEGGDRYFFASRSPSNLVIPAINWDYRGQYFINNQELTLIFEGTQQRFLINIVNDATIELTHFNSGTKYQFVGFGNIVYTKNLSEIPITDNL